jgi:hypothetical protein
VAHSSHHSQWSSPLLPFALLRPRSPRPRCWRRREHTPSKLAHSSAAIHKRLEWGDTWNVRPGTAPGKLATAAIAEDSSFSFHPPEQPASNGNVGFGSMQEGVQVGVHVRRPGWAV